MATKKTVKKVTAKVQSKNVVKKNDPSELKKVNKNLQQNPKTIVENKPVVETISKTEIAPVNQPMNPELKRKLIAIITAAVSVSLFAGFIFYVIPTQILSQTIDKQNAKNAEQAQIDQNIRKEGVQARLDFEGGVLKFDQNSNWDMTMKIKDFGDLKLNLKTEYAPKTVENFVRLAYREYFNNTIFHRIVKQPTFGVIQGGDADKRDGNGGKSAFYVDENEVANIPDELWLVKPEFTTVGEQNALSNKPEFRYPDLYKDFNTDTGSVTYKKGLILMAKTNDPDSASSQFFITTTDTTLPAQYTVFGTIDSSSFAVLDKINAEVQPIELNKEGVQEVGFDGKPSKEIVLEKVEIVSPKIGS